MGPSLKTKIIKRDIGRESRSIPVSIIGHLLICWAIGRKVIFRVLGNHKFYPYNVGEQIEIKAEFWCAKWYSGQLFHFLAANLGKVNHSENEFYQMKSYMILSWVH